MIFKDRRWPNEISYEIMEKELLDKYESLIRELMEILGMVLDSDHQYDNYNDWKKKINIGKINNQKFTIIPFNQFIKMVEYKAYEKGIKVIITEESYTSKASFFDYDTPPAYNKSNKEKHSFSGKRIERGLYKTKEGKLVNADVNGALNIIIKVIPDAFSKPRDIGLVANPLVLSIA